MTDKKSRPRQKPAARKTGTGEKTTTKSKTPPPVNDGDDEDFNLTGWSQPIDLTDALNGEAPPEPSICRWQDDEITRALFYPNEVHSVFGEPESMKSWLVLHAAAQEIKRGALVYFLDLEANDRSITGRLRDLGVEPGDIKNRFRYFRPEEAITDDDHHEIAAAVHYDMPSMVVVDGVTEGLAMHGYKTSASEDIAMWFLQVTRRFMVTPTVDYPGPAIVELDHVVKDRDSRGGWAIGSGHKKAGIKGAAYNVDVAAPFGKGRHGVSRVFLEKDSPGGVGWTPYGKQRRRLVAEFHAVSGADGSIDAYLETQDAKAREVDVSEDVPLAETPRFKDLQERVCKYVKGHPGSSYRVVRANVTGSASDIATALDALAGSGHIRNDSIGNARSWVWVREFEAHYVERKKKAGSK